MIRSKVRRGRPRLAPAGVIVGAVVALWLVASPSALAQLSFSSSNRGIKGARPCGGGGSDFNGDSHLDIATTNEGVPIFPG